MITRFLLHQIPTLIFMVGGYLFYCARQNTVQGNFTTADLWISALFGVAVTLSFVRGLWDWTDRR